MGGVGWKSELRSLMKTRNYLCVVDLVGEYKGLISWEVKNEQLIFLVKIKNKEIKVKNNLYSKHIVLKNEF